MLDSTFLNFGIRSFPSNFLFCCSEKLQLLEKDSSKRLGTKDCPEGEVYEQQFFRPIDWGALERKELEAPFKPRVVHYLSRKGFASFLT